MKIPIKILIVTLLLSIAVGIGYAMSEKFNDRDKTPDLAKNGVEKPAETGVVKGYEDGNFDPNDSVTKAQLAAILDRHKYLFSSDYANVLMNYTYFEDTNLDYGVQTALALAMAKRNPVESPSESNNFALSAACEFKEENLEDYGAIQKINSDEIPNSYDVYYCDQDIYYGAGYFVHHSYTGGIPGTGTTGTIDQWYGPFAPNIVLSN